MARQVEVDVVAHVDDGGEVGDSSHLYPELALPAQPVGHTADHVAGVALLGGYGH